MQLDYFSLLSFRPSTFKGIGSIKSPTLKEIDKIGHDTYNTFLSMMLMDIKSYYEAIDKYQDDYFKIMSNEDVETIKSIREEYFSFSNEDRNKVKFYDVMTFDVKFRSEICDALNFFMVDEVKYDDNNRAFATYDGTLNSNKEKMITGYIYSANYVEIVDVILQRNGIQAKSKKTMPKFKSELAREVWELTHTDENKDSGDGIGIGDIISSVSAIDNSLNMINIWDLTIFQLYDQFKRHQHNEIYKISSYQVGYYGDENNKFDSGAWYKNIN